MNDTHSRTIAAAARMELTELGFRQQGRSRLWLADRGSWLNVVEFTPSKWSRSMSLMNAAHWLWVGTGFMSFNEAVPSKLWINFATEEQFRGAASKLATEAQAEARAIDVRFPSFDAVAEFVVKRAESDPERMGPSWWGYEAGIASGLLGRSEEASRFLHGLTDQRVIKRAAHLLPLVGEPIAFRSAVNEAVVQQRARLKLEPLDRPTF